MNPYVILGVHRNASHRAIKVAYRERAKSAHPDAGGSADAFLALNRAWKVLSDPERRRLYDETGQIAEEAADNGDAMAAAVLIEAFKQAVQETQKRGGDVFTIDMVN